MCAKYNIMMCCSYVRSCVGLGAIQSFLSMGMEKKYMISYDVTLYKCGYVPVRSDNH